MAATGREFFTVKAVSEALSGFRPGHLTPVESVPLGDAYRRVPDEEIVARETLPGFDRSSVDGYAVRAADTFGASESIPGYLRVAGAVRMGAPATDQVSPSTAVAIPTGGMLPAGADAVVMVEHTAEATLETIEVVRPVAPGENVVRFDEDAAPGTPLASSGRPLRAHDLALLAAAGIAEVSVHARPRVTILATGDEVVPPDTPALAPGEVRDALSVSIGALVREAGGVVAGAPTIVPDDEGALHDALIAAVRASDVVVICAGSSVGMRDQTAAAVAALPNAETWCHGLAIKPGKPTLLAHSGGIPIIGLPGNPRSALVVFRLIGMPLVRRVGGWTVEPLAGTIRATLARDLPSAAGRLDVVQVRLGGSGERLVEPVLGSSALLSVLTAADGYVIVPEDASGLSAGEAVEMFPYG